MNAPFPNNVSELNSSLTLNFCYRSFLTNILAVLQPLHRILYNGVMSSWSKAFQKVKQMLFKIPVLHLLMLTMMLL